MAALSGFWRRSPRQLSESHRKNAARINSDAVDWMSARLPFFAFLNYYDTHAHLSPAVLRDASRSIPSPLPTARRFATGNPAKACRIPRRASNWLVGGEEMFDESADPRERRNLAGDDPSKAELMRFRTEIERLFHPRNRDEAWPTSHAIQMFRDIAAQYAAARSGDKPPE